MKVKSTKTWDKLPCAHAQFFDKEPDGSVGECASWHGYDRSVRMVFTGEVDEMGWIVPFGELRQIKKFLEYYFDHTALIPANDPRKNQVIALSQSTYPPMFKHRVLPYGVSMEMSALFIWEQVSPYVYSMTGGRCYVERVECYEHASNMAFIEATVHDNDRLVHYVELGEPYLVMKPEWDWQEPRAVMARYFQAK